MWLRPTVLRRPSLELYDVSMLQIYIISCLKKNKNKVKKKKKTKAVYWK